MVLLQKLHFVGMLVAHFLVSTTVVSAAYAFNKPQVRVTTTFADFDARIMDQWGPGGGKFVKISNDSHHPFQERTFGGAKRTEIQGSRIFGSGYPYGANDSSTVAGRPFPFGTWPLWWDQDFMGSNEYGPHLDAIRPGGMLVSVPLRTTADHFNITDTEVYYAIGDKESLLLLMISYVTWCHVVPTWPSRFDPRLPNSTIRLENIIQYFRASSFAVASPEYNNTFAQLPSSNSMESNPLPDFIEYSPFRQCINNATFHALPILNKPPSLTPLGKFIVALAFAGEVLIPAFVVVAIGALLGIGTLFGTVVLAIRYILCSWIPESVKKSLQRRRERRGNRLATAQAIARARTQELRYENYP
ncbi:hypothetical protein FRC18_009737 [Serendipita sp. 400]|nr:hypothetical protein FRC18_009737 [Serendipita sp. 400]